MGARSYIPQLGRFEQADPQPGGSINAYAYTDDDPVNQADPTGEWTTNYENAETGEAAPGTPRSGNGPGAVVPPPADLQAEQEFAAHPPWDAVSVYESDAIVVGSAGMGAEEARLVSHRWEVQPTTAGALGWLLVSGNSPIGQATVGTIPGWLVKVVDAMTGGQLNTYGAELMAASDLAAPGTLVTIEAWGSARLGVHIDVSYWVERDD